MAARVLAIRSERESGQATLAVAVSNVDGPQADTFALPAGFGDCYVLKVVVYATSIATLRATPTEAGPTIILLASSTEADFLDALPWVVGYDELTLTAVFRPFIAVLWRESELAIIGFGEVDVNASPTADVLYMFLVQRRQNMPAPTAPEGPLIFTS